MVELREQLTIWMMAGRSGDKHFFSSMVGIGMRLWDLLLVLFMMDSISSVVTVEKLSNLQKTTGVSSSSAFKVDTMVC